VALCQPVAGAVLLERALTLTLMHARAKPGTQD
jgi:hypothetical protein